MAPSLSPNFAYLEQHDEQLVRLGLLAERYFPDDPNTTLLKLRQFAELLAQLTASQTGIYSSPEEPQFELLRRLQDASILPREIAQLFSEVRRAGNSASHKAAGDHRTALSCLKICWQLGLWYHRTFAQPGYESGPFTPPATPSDNSSQLEAELTELRRAFDAYRKEHGATLEELEQTQIKLRSATDEQAFWAEMADTAERANSDLQQKLATLQSAAAAEPKEALATKVESSRQAAERLQLDERETRQLIDEQLREAGWEA
ncbi:MAG: type I restriction-modification system endonuclease, partial [Dehalococcoidia bacterium]